MNESFKTDPSLATSARAAKESGSYLCASNVTPTAVRFIVSVFLCVCCASAECLPHKWHVRTFGKSAEKKTKTGRLPIAHYKQKPAGSDLWPVNRCIPSIMAIFMLAQLLSCCYHPVWACSAPCRSIKEWCRALEKPCVLHFIQECWLIYRCWNRVVCLFYWKACG